MNQCAADCDYRNFYAVGMVTETDLCRYMSAEAAEFLMDLIDTWEYTWESGADSVLINFEEFESDGYTKTQVRRFLKMFSKSGPKTFWYIVTRPAVDRLGSPCLRLDLNLQRIVSDVFRAAARELA